MADLSVRRRHAVCATAAALPRPVACRGDDDAVMVTWAKWLNWKPCTSWFVDPDLLDRRADALRLAVARRIASVGLLMRWPGLPLRWQRAVGASLLPSCGPTLTPDGVARRPAARQVPVGGRTLILINYCSRCCRWMDDPELGK